MIKIKLFALICSLAILCGCVVIQKRRSQFPQKTKEINASSPVGSDSCPAAEKSLMGKNNLPSNLLVRKDVEVFLDIKTFDLDRDGKKEVIFLYRTDTQKKGVRIISLKDDIAKVVYNKLFDYSKLELKIKGADLFLLATPSKSRIRLNPKDIYLWNGEKFIMVGGCPYRNKVK